MVSELTDDPLYAFEGALNVGMVSELMTEVPVGVVMVDELMTEVPVRVVAELMIGVPVSVVCALATKALVGVKTGELESEALASSRRPPDARAVSRRPSRQTPSFEVSRTKI